MLNLREIQNRIVHPSACSREDISQLKELCDEFPYTQIYPILYLKALASTNDVRFENALNSYAFRIADRKQLYDLVHEVNQLGSQNSPVEQVTIEPTPQEVEKDIQQDESPEPNNLSNDDKGSEIVSISSMDDSKKEELDWEEELDTGITLNIASKENSEDISSESEGFSELADTPVQAEVLTVSNEANESWDDDQFNKELLAEAISANYNLDHLTNFETETTVDTNYKPVDQSEPDKPETQSIRSFSGWLRSNENKRDSQFDDEKAHIEDIVNRFIDNEPRISRTNQKETIERPKKPFFSPTQVAKESLDIQAMPVSETLAKIFAVQGNYPKAIFAYEQLILLNPEKKAFFASQINELKKKLTQ